MGRNADTDIMDQETFRKFQQACCKGQFATFLNIAHTLPLAQLEDPVRRNVWLFYSELLQRAFETEKTSEAKLKSFAKNEAALGEVFLTLPLADQAFWSLRAFAAFYKGCQRAGVDTDNSLIEQMVDKALATPSEQMKDLSVSNVLPLLTLCQSSTNSKLQDLGRHYAQGVEEHHLIRNRAETIVAVLPYISFDINLSNWSDNSGTIRAMVEHKAAEQQAQRLKKELPDTPSTSSRKM